MSKKKDTGIDNSIANVIEGLRERKFDEVLERYFMYFKTAMYIGIIFFFVAAAGAQMGVLPLGRADLATILFAIFLGIVLFSLVDITKAVVEIKYRVPYKPVKIKK